MPRLSEITMPLLSRVDPDRFSKFASGAQSIVMSVAVLAAGVWAYFTFWELGSAQKASADLEKARAEIAEIDQRIAEQLVLSIDLKSDVFGEISDGKRPVSITATLRNDGKQPLQFTNTVLRITKLLDDSSDIDPEAIKFHIEPKYLNDKGELDVMPRREFIGKPRLLDVSMVRHISFLVPPLSPGRYLVQIESEFQGTKYTNGTWVDSREGWGFAFEQGNMFVPNAASPSHDTVTNISVPHEAR